MTAVPDVTENPQTYDRLHQVLAAGLRRQLLFGVCEDEPLVQVLSQRLTQDLETDDVLLFTIPWDVTDPKLLATIASVLQDHPYLTQATNPPILELRNVAQLTRQPAPIQQQFLRQLRSLGRHLPELEFNLVVWVNGPWLHQIQHSVPEFWRCHTGVFPFASEQGIRPVGYLPPRPSTPSKEGVFPLVTLAGQWESGPDLEALVQQYRERIAQGETSRAVLDQAILAAEQWLHQLPAQALAQMVDLFNDLGNFYWMRSRRQDPAPSPDTAASIAPARVDLEKALHQYHRALQNIGAGPNTADTYAMLHNNIGAVYSDLAQYCDRCENIQQAIWAYEASLSHRDPERDRAKFGASQNNLGTAYWHLSQHQDPLPNLKAAIAAYHQAVAQYETLSDWANWAMIQTNLGTTYWMVAQHEPQAEYLEAAIAAYCASLTHRTPDADPLGCATTHNNLAAAYWHLASDRDRDPETAKTDLLNAAQSYQTASQLGHTLSIQNPPRFVSFDFPTSYHNLGIVHYQLATESRIPFTPSEKLHHLNAALQAYSQTLDFLTPSTDLYQTTVIGIVQAIRTCYELGGIDGQNRALNAIPGTLLPQILPQLKG
ncbi:tetratricopeptide repeat protein [Spirulina major]|uniref:tetratricopeptide repeat protein n=1 Tax=Spirulina major TaxID=270636 RepID=UPI0009343E3C|nr:tetratricopeptide repeat protein [Spirulina major]